MPRLIAKGAHTGLAGLIVLDTGLACCPLTEGCSLRELILII